MIYNRNMKRLLLSLLLGAVLLSGCSQLNKNHIETEVVRLYNEETAKRGTGVTCTKVTLVAESNTKLTGIAEMSDNTKMDVNVTIDPVSGQFVWRVTP